MKKQEKNFAVLDLAERIKQAKTIVLVDFRGLNALQMNNLRNLVREAEGELKVVKNTLFKRALDQAKMPALELTGSTALILSQKDELAALKAVFGFSKTYGLPTFKSGIWEDRILTREEIERLATLPSQQELFGKIFGLLTAPAIRLNQVLSGNEQKLVYILQSRLERMNSKKEGGEN